MYDNNVIVEVSNRDLLNGHDIHMITDALDLYVKALEEDIQDMENNGGKRSIFAPGFFNGVKKDLLTKISNLRILEDTTDYDS
jgi:hypothetical protein